jgi:hypothetical protein
MLRGKAGEGGSWNLLLEVLRLFRPNVKLDIHDTHRVELDALFRYAGVRVWRHAVEMAFCVVCSAMANLLCRVRTRKLVTRLNLSSTGSRRHARRDHAQPPR